MSFHACEKKKKKKKIRINEGDEEKEGFWKLKEGEMEFRTWGFGDFWILAGNGRVVESQ